MGRKHGDAQECSKIYVLKYTECHPPAPVSLNFSHPHDKDDHDNVYVALWNARSARNKTTTCYDYVLDNGAFRLPSFYICRRLSTLSLVFCVTTSVTRTDIRNAQSCCERLASADVDRCTAMKSEQTIMNLMQCSLLKPGCVAQIMLLLVKYAPPRFCIYQCPQRV